MNECFYPTCKLKGAWIIYPQGNRGLLSQLSCIEHIGHAIAADQCSPRAANGYVVRKRES